jgi:hypothetical protein
VSRHTPTTLLGATRVCASALVACRCARVESGRRDRLWRRCERRSGATTLRHRHAVEYAVANNGTRLPWLTDATSVETGAILTALLYARCRHVAVCCWRGLLSGRRCGRRRLLLLRCRTGVLFAATRAEIGRQKRVATAKRCRAADCADAVHLHRAAIGVGVGTLVVLVARVVVAIIAAVDRRIDDRDRNVPVRTRAEEACSRLMNAKVARRRSNDALRIRRRLYRVLVQLRASRAAHERRHIVGSERRVGPEHIVVDVADAGADRREGDLRLIKRSRRRDHETKRRLKLDIGPARRAARARAHAAVVATQYRVQQLRLKRRRRAAYVGNEQRNEKRVHLLCFFRSFCCAQAQTFCYKIAPNHRL